MTCAPGSSATGVSWLVRLLLRGQPGARQIRPDHKGVAPYPDSRRDLPQLGVGASSPVIYTVRLIYLNRMEQFSITSNCL